MVDAEAILNELRYNTGTFPKQALQAAIENREQMTPLLLKELEEARKSPHLLYQNNYIGHIYAMYLLAQFREKRAYPVIMAFISQPDEIVMNCMDEIITDDLPRILASVAQGDTNLTKALIENNEMNEWIRGAALITLLTQMVQGELTREELMTYYQRLFRGGLKREPSHVWNELACGATEIHPEEVIDDIRKAYEEGLVEEQYIQFSEVNAELAKKKESVLAKLGTDPNHKLIDNVVDELKNWACFETVEPRPLEIPKNFLPEKVYQPPPFAELKVGRNDPCPCGSGKKYKKCCGKE